MKKEKSKEVWKRKNLDVYQKEMKDMMEHFAQIKLPEGHSFSGVLFLLEKDEKGDYIELRVKNQAFTFYMGAYILLHLFKHPKLGESFRIFAMKVLMEARL